MTDKETVLNRDSIAYWEIGPYIANIYKSERKDNLLRIGIGFGEYSVFAVEIPADKGLTLADAKLGVIEILRKKLKTWSEEADRYEKEHKNAL